MRGHGLVREFGDGDGDIVGWYGKRSQSKPGFFSLVIWFCVYLSILMYHIIE